MFRDKALTEIFGAIIGQGAKSAIKYLGPKSVIKGTFHGKRDKRARSVNVVLSIGAPNYAERQFIKKAVAAGEPFPIKKVVLKFAPAKKKAA